jgi:hypothetical protein
MHTRERTVLFRRSSMTFPNTINVMLQGIAALLIYVAGYLALVLFTIISLVIAELISERANLARAYELRSVSLDSRNLYEIEGDARRSPLLGHIFRHPTPKRLS